MHNQQNYLLAVDAGVRTGLALFNDSGRLLWYRSHNMGSVASLKKAAFRLVGSIPELKYIGLEGGGQIALIWKKIAEQKAIHFMLTDAARWRHDLLYSREQRSGELAKAIAINMAVRFLKNNGTPPPQTPTDDAAEAILAGIWCCYKLGWIKQLPDLH